MTTNELTTESPNDTWTAELAALKARYKHVREPILVALQILKANPDIALDDAKAQAAAHGARITAASVSAAQRLLSRMDLRTAAPEADPASTPAPVHPARRRRPKEPTVDAEALIRGVVAKLHVQGNAEANRLRDGIRRAITILQGLVT